MKSYRLTATADGHLQDIWRFSATRWNAAQADDYLAKIEAALKSALTTPALLRPRPELGDGIHACAAGSHIVYGTIENGEFLVIAVLHARMDPGRLKGS